MSMLTSMKELPFYYWYIWTINAYIRKKKKKEKCREKRKREREANIPQVTWKTNKALTQDLYRSRRHRASSRGGLENPSGKVSLAGFHCEELAMEKEKEPQPPGVSAPKM